MAFGESIVKYLLFFSNFLFSVAGLTLLGLGIAIHLKIKEVVDIADQSFQIAPIACMVVGGIIFIIAFLGCCGAIKESNCLLVSYAIIMLILMLIKIILVVLILLRLNDIRMLIPKWLEAAFKNNPKIFEAIQKTFQCCGTIGHQSYKSGAIPSDCCAVPSCTIVNSYSGCNMVVKEFIDIYGLSLAAVLIVIISIELVTAVFGLCLARHVRENNRWSRY